VAAQIGRLRKGKVRQKWILVVSVFRARLSEFAGNWAFCVTVMLR
jgi:hypothetical protein